MASRPSIDLHSLRPEMALKRLEQGLHTARAAGSPQAMVITGRGIGNRLGQPVLRDKVENWLRGPSGKRMGVTSFVRASKGGALLVELGKSK